ncbi:unnamed protein product [Boreogadus saida]
MALGAGGTNFGHCVDLFASGDDIVSGSSDCTTPVLHLTQRDVPGCSPCDSPNTSSLRVLQKILGYSIRDSINLLTVPETHRLPTPNLLAAMPLLQHLATQISKAPL